MTTHERARLIAQALLAIDAVGFTPETPITFKSGLRSPVYVDNRRLPFHPDSWRLVIEGFAEHAASEGLTFDVIAGIETGGIPHSAALGYTLRRPSIFVRKQEKAHGTQSKIEGGVIDAKQVLLIEDLVTTGGSSLAGVEALRAGGAQVDHCLAIVSYGFAEARAAFKAAQVTLTTLTDFTVILDEAARQQQYSAECLTTVRDWFAEPHGWAERYGR